MWEVGDWGSTIAGGGRLGVKHCGRREIVGLQCVGSGRLTPPCYWRIFCDVIDLFAQVYIVFI